jgi:hypothetical protein
MLKGDIVRIRVLAVALLAFGGALCSSSLAAGGSLASSAPPDMIPAVAQQSPVPRFSTIPPLLLPPTPTLSLPTPTPTPPPRAAPAVPTPIPPRPAADIMTPSSPAPRAGGVPTELVVLLLGGSATALGAGLYMFVRSRPR